MKKESIITTKAPSAIGPYSQGIKVGDFIYTSGQLPIIPETKQLVSEDIKKAATQSLQNVKAVLEQAGASLDSVVKTTVFLDVKRLPRNLGSLLYCLENHIEIRKTDPLVT